MALINETTDSRSFLENDDERRRTLQWLVPWNEAENEAPSLGDPYQTVDPPPAFEDTACKCINVEIRRDPKSGKTADKQGIALMTATYSTKTPGTGENHDIIREWDLGAEMITDYVDLDGKQIAGGQGVQRYSPRAVYRYTRDRTSLDNLIIMSLTGTVNDTAFMGRPAHTFLFLGARAIRKNFELWTITYEFEYAPWDPPNNKYGQRHTVIDVTGETVTAHRIYQESDFGLLGIGTG